MTRSTDVLDRVAAANPVPTGTTRSPDEDRDADALLKRLLATAATDAPARHSRQWTRSLVLAVAAAAVIIAVTVANALDRGPNVVERAYAAVSKPALYHVVRSTTIDAPRWLKLGDAVPARDLVMESWYSLDPPAYHEVYYKVRNGHRRVHLEWAGGPNGTTVADSGAHKDFKWMEGQSVNAERFDPTAQFKAAYREGNVHEQGTVTADGRRAHRLVIEHARPPVNDPAFTVRSSHTIALFDAQTMHPIEFIDESDVESNGRRATVIMRTHYATFETLPRTPENLAKLQIPKQP